MIVKLLCWDLSSSTQRDFIEKAYTNQQRSISYQLLFNVSISLHSLVIILVLYGRQYMSTLWPRPTKYFININWSIPKAFNKPTLYNPSLWIISGYTAHWAIGNILIEQFQNSFATVRQSNAQVPDKIWIILSLRQNLNLKIQFSVSVTFV